ncbi:MAG: nicotinate phosphoribosyltransferase [Burkholderiales bacterium]|nr:nicotinate phosphoribosyltransferase [Burkholderiales bacterium]
MSALLADLYEFTMLQSYLEQNMTKTAVFEFFVRKLPPNRNFLVAAGLEEVLDFLENMTFLEEELDYLSGIFPAFVIDYLQGFRFDGEVHAMAEGTIFFQNEPILRITAPLPQAQLVESRIMNLLHFETLIASKAARSVLTAPDRRLVDFGLRRAHGAEAGLLAARASYLAGFSGTATVLAGMKFGIPIFGTMAHSFVEAHEDEMDAFRNFARSHPGSTLLLDTFDTELAAEKVVALAREGWKIGGVRLDSGDLAMHAGKVRSILDAGGLRDTVIFASGNLDEYAVNRLLDCPIDGFGIGTALVTSEDHPMLDCAYKLQEYDGRPCRKRSEGKATWPGTKQVFRLRDSRGKLEKDVISLECDDLEGERLVGPVMHEGKRLHPRTPIARLRERTMQNYASLPESLRKIDAENAHPVEISQLIHDLSKRADRREIHPLS